MSPRSLASYNRRALAALIAVFALMVQALTPAAAMAARADASGAFVICTATGARTLSPAGAVSAHRPAESRHGFGGMPCQDCLAAAMAAVSATPTPVAQPVVYEIARIEHASTPQLLAPRARAPPRPPGQGPPSSLQYA